MESLDVSYSTALIAGVFTFLAPCVLPLVPAYLSFISGSSLEDLISDDQQRRAHSRSNALKSGLFFVLGLGAVFIALGASATALGGFLGSYKREFAIVGALVIILFGFHYMGLFRIGFLNMEKRFHLQNKPVGLLGAMLLGAAFGFGWTPCVGPVLSLVLLQASQSESVLNGIILLSIYAAGLGIPFLIAASFASQFMTFLSKFRRHLGKIELLLGSLLVVSGILILSDGLAWITSFLLEAFPTLQTLS